jgi:hypothetical protein
MLDIFTDDAFGVVPLTLAVNKLKYVPGRISQMGLFNEESVDTTVVAVEEQNGVLKLIAPTPRGGPGTTIDKSKRSLRPISVPHFEINDSVMADEVQGVRAFGQESAVETVQGKVMKRGQVHSQSHAATQEYQRIGAIKGLITYAGGSTLDLFNIFDVSQHTEIDFALDATSPAPGALMKKCNDVVRKSGDELEEVPYSYIHCLCGDNFFDDLTSHPEVIESYKGTPMAQVLREGYMLPNGNKIWGAFAFGRIVFENYRGKVGSTSFIDTDKAHFFPVGAPGLFETRFAPADYVETVNTMGRRMYMKQYLMPNDKGVHLDTQMNAIDFCSRPRTLIKAKRT